MKDSIEFLKRRLQYGRYLYPIKVVLEQRSWGAQYVVRDGENRHVQSLSLNGNSKQRRQQLRYFLSEMKKAEVQCPDI